MDTLLTNCEKVYLLSLKGKFNHIEDVLNKILAEEYDLEIHKVTEVTKRDFIRSIYIKLTSTDIIYSGPDINKYIIERLTLLGYDAEHSMVSDMTWLPKNKLDELDVYSCDHSFLQ